MEGKNFISAHILENATSRTKKIWAAVISGVVLILIQIFIAGDVLQVDSATKAMELDWSRYEFKVTVEVVIVLIGWFFSVGNALFDKALDFDEIRLYDNGLGIYDGRSGQAEFAPYKDVHIVFLGKSMKRFILFIPSLELKRENEVWDKYSDGEMMRDNVKEYAPQCFVSKKRYKELVKDAR